MKLIAKLHGGGHLVEITDGEATELMAALATVDRILNIEVPSQDVNERDGSKRPPQPRPPAKLAVAQPTPAGKTKACVVCGKQFAPRTGAKCCGQDCSAKRLRDQKAEFARKARKATTAASTEPARSYNTTCIVCKSEFVAFGPAAKLCQKCKDARLNAIKAAVERTGNQE